MKSNVFTIIRFIAALITIIAILGRSYIPPKVLLLYPRDNASISLFGSVDANGNSAADWIDRDRSHWRCDFRAAVGIDKFCGFALSWQGHERLSERPITSDHPLCGRAESDPDGDGLGWENGRSCVLSSLGEDLIYPVCQRGVLDADGDGWSSENEQRCIMRSEFTTPMDTAGAVVEQVPRGMDFSKYDRLRINIDYEGRAKHLRIFMRNHNPAYSDHAAYEKGKFMSAFLRTEELKAGPAFVGLSEFSVAEWWVLAEDVGRELSMPEFNNIVSIGIDHVDYGIHKMRIQRIVLEGERVSVEHFLMAALFTWVIYLLLETWIRYYQLNTSCTQRALQIGELASQAETLAAENNALPQSLIDPLTGIFNRVGLAKKAKQLLSDNHKESEIGVLLLDIDHFKGLSDTQGHDFGDKILRTFVNLININIREDDIFARWGGKEFVILCPRASRSIVIILGEKLRAVVASYVFDSNRHVDVTVSIGGTVTPAGGDFSSIFKRVDQALYKAKERRNSFEFEP